MNWAPPPESLTFVPLRAQGPGGQHVNRTESAIQLRFDSRAADFPAAVQQRLQALAGRRMDRDGVVVLKAQAARSQALNRQAALKRLLALVAEAYAVPRARRATRPSRASVARRLDDKRRQACVKATRRRADTGD